MLEPDTAIALAASAIAERDFASAISALEMVSPPVPTAVLACHIWASESIMTLSAPPCAPAFREALWARLDAFGERGVQSMGATLALLVELAGAHRSDAQRWGALNAMAAEVRRCASLATAPYAASCAVVAAGIGRPAGGCAFWHRPAAHTAVDVATAVARVVRAADRADDPAAHAADDPADDRAADAADDPAAQKVTRAAIRFEFDRRLGRAVGEPPVAGLSRTMMWIGVTRERAFARIAALQPPRYYIVAVFTALAALDPADRTDEWTGCIAAALADVLNAGLSDRSRCRYLDQLLALALAFLVRAAFTGPNAGSEWIRATLLPDIADALIGQRPLMLPPMII